MDHSRNTVVVANNLFVKNSAPKGGAIFCLGTDSCYFINNTFTRNVSYLSPGVTSVDSGTHFYYNNCFFDNYSILSATTDTLVNDIFSDSALTVSFHNCLLGRFDTIGCSSLFSDCIIGNIDPLFSDTAADDYSLKKESPCIDAGNNALYPAAAGEMDLTGNVRITGATIDIGAFEYREFISTRNKPSARFSLLQRKPYHLSLRQPKQPFHGFLLNGTSVRHSRVRTGRNSLQPVIISTRD
jgi:predicted outer membrane repeat protein